MQQIEKFIRKVMPDTSEVRGGHIPNYVMPRWFDEARQPLWEKVTRLSDEGVIFGTVRHLELEFKREVLPALEVKIITTVSKIGNSSAVCEQQAWQGNELAVTCRSVLVATHKELRTKVALNAAAKNYLEQLCCGNKA